MICPNYEGNGKCGFKSRFYELSKETIEDRCTLDYPACEIFVEHAYRRLEEAKSGVEDRVKKLDDASKPDPEFLRKIMDPLSLSLPK